MPGVGQEIRFSGIPWTIANPAWGSWYQGAAGGGPSAAGLNLIGGGPPPMQVTNPKASQAWGEAQGLLGLLEGTGAGAISAGKAGQAQIQGYAGQLAGMGRQLFGEFAYNDPYAQQALQQGFDPLKAQEQYYQQQLLDQTGAGLAASGLAGTPYGAEATGAAQAAFQNQWEMQRLQREQTAAQTATTLQAQELAAQTAGAQLIDEAGQLDIGALQQMLSAYGISGQNLASATSLINDMFNALQVSTSQSLSIS